MNWSTANDLKTQLLRLWERGELLRDAVNGNPRFPLRLTLKGPASNDLTERFQAVRAWVAALSAAPHLRLEWQEVRHRVQGSQRLPASAWVDSLEEALAWLGKRRDGQRFQSLIDTTCQSQPALLPWLEKRPLQVLELADDWPLLLSIVGWMKAHPRPGLYLRQVDLPGVHSKFIESHRGVLAELFDLALPADAIDTTKTGVAQFAARYGFLDKPQRLRFRLLDPTLPWADGLTCPDVTLDAASFSRLRLPIRRVFITENEINFLAFPPVEQAVVVFGAGYGWEALAQSRWLHSCTIYYWGDLDTHGFAILDQLRHHFPQAISFLMDRATLEGHSSAWGFETTPVLTELSGLTAAERVLYDDLRFNRICQGLRLEQERIGFLWLNQALSAL
ncbi:MAG: DUF3322 domain-containing protein [Gallionella sp.]|nr:DUF3322 domain-containing protein [Gallionella sp.]MDD4945810.1 DUF3322 domain-containing protein [Gallionella sp.]MDD5612376.1 DUF3322 domain-containing protein [Gallionella sp.]